LARPIYAPVNLEDVFGGIDVWDSAVVAIVGKEAEWGYEAANGKFGFFNWISAAKTCTSTSWAEKGAGFGYTYLDSKSSIGGSRFSGFSTGYVYYSNHDVSYLHFTNSGG
jgi:hypothetical protein